MVKLLTFKSEEVINIVKIIIFFIKIVCSCFDVINILVPISIYLLIIGVLNLMV